MPPWNEKRPSDVLDTKALGYHYDTDDYLMPGDVIYPGQWIFSADRKYNLYYDPNDNNLRLGSASWKQYWASTDRSQPYGRCSIEDDGNLVIRDRFNKALFASTTQPGPGASLRISSGDVTKVGIYRWDGSPTSFVRPPPLVG
jgi:hypothetical protein